MAASEVPIDGFCDPAFEPVREAFRENFDQFDEVGASVALRIHGRQVLDLWGGWRDEEKTRLWEKDTLVNCYSVGKGITAILVLALVGQRRLDPDQPMAAVWPEFAAAGKEKVTLRQILAHQGGLPALREELPDKALSDWRRITTALAAQEPFWEPGTAHGYHVNTHGFLTGEMARRASGAPSFRRALRDVLTQPLEAEFHIGLPLYAHRLCADIIGGTARPIDIAHARDFVAPPSGDAATDEMKFKAYFNPPAITGQGVINSSWWRSLQIPSTNGHATARAVTRIYAAALDGSLFPQSVLDDACTPQVDGLDRILDRPTRFGLGFQLAQDSRPIGPNARTFGHFGYGGSLGFADPDTGLAFAYVMNRPGERWQSPRAGALIDAAYACL